VSSSRENSRSAFLVGFLSWTYDPFDFFIVTFVLAQPIWAEGISCV